MDIWITRAKRLASCRYCPKPVTKGQIIVMGKSWSRNKEVTRRWSFKFIWHIGCWIKQGIQALEEKERRELPFARIRTKRIILSDEDMEKRRKLILRRGAIIQRIKAETGKRPLEQSIEKIVKWGEQLDTIKEQVTVLGGVPKKW